MRSEWQDCWVYDGAIRRDGYARTTCAGRWVMVHRAAYEALRGPIPDGLQLDHLCRNRACFNSEHLEPVTQAENIRRGISGLVNGARKLALTHCPQGHPYDAHNTTTVEGHRRCLTCKRIRSRNARARRRAVTA